MRNPRRFYTLLASVGLVLYLGAFLGQARLAALPEAEVQRLSLRFPVTLEGMRAGGPGELARLAEAFPTDRVVTLVDASGASYTIRTVPAFSRLYILVTGLSGILFWSVAAFVFVPRIGQPAVPFFFWCTFLYGWAIMIGGVYFPRFPVPATIALDLAQLGCLIVLPLLFVHLVLRFPRTAPALPRLRWPLRALAGTAAVLWAWQGTTFLRYYADPGPARAGALRPPETAAGLFLVVLVTAGFAGLAFRGRRLELTREKNQVKWLLWGFMVGVAPYVFLRTLPALLGLDPPLPPLFDRVFELAIPLAFVSAVVLFRLFDIDLLIRRSLIYGLLAAAFVLFNVVLGFAAARWILPVWPDGVWPLLTGMGLIAGVSFRPLRNRIGLWVDRVFFKIRHDHDLALARFRPRIEEAPGCTELADRLVPFLRERLGSSRTAVVLRLDGEMVSAGDVEPSQGPFLLAGIERRLPSALLPLAAPDVTSLPELELSTFPGALTREGFVLVQPFPSGRPLPGAILLGPKETEWRYVDPDLRFLADLARMAGGALDRITLVRRVAEESIERRRLDELNRMKSDFLYQVAHDLRTPLADIGWRFQNLLDGVVGDLEDPQEEYLKTAQTSAAHLTRMVENLLDVSRLERTVAAPAPEPVVLEEVISEAAASLQHLLEQKKVSLRIESGDGPTTVQAHRGKLFEVAMNLLDNAAKYTAPGTEIEVEVMIPVDGQPRFRVRDRGPGIDPAALDGLFTPFRQGKESPYSSRVGFGLGLYISRAYMELFGGTLEARNHPEGGAMFTCTFPRRSPERSTP